MEKQEIINYYRQCQSDYELFWDLNHSYAMHAGFWDKTTKNLGEALKKENEVLAQIAKIQKEDHVLDAGCGVGGSSFYLAKRYGCQVTGISISPYQIDQANLLAKQFALHPYLRFFEEDFTATSFSNQTFDVVWAIESVCHAQEKQQFIQESYRILKPGGRLIVADGFLKSPSSKANAQMNTWLKGWGVDQLDTFSEFKEKLLKEGFGRISYRNISANVIPSSKRLYHISLPAWIVSKAGEWLGLRSSVQTQNILSAYYQYRTLREGMWEYGIFYAEKI